LISKIN